MYENNTSSAVGVRLLLQVVGVFRLRPSQARAAGRGLTRLAALACSAMRPTPAGRPAIAIRNGPFPLLPFINRPGFAVRVHRAVGASQVYLGIDIGTSSVKAVLVDDSGAIAAQASDALTVSRPQPGFSEQDPEAWWQATVNAVRGLPSGPRSAVRSVGLSGQMHGPRC